MRWDWWVLIFGAGCVVLCWAVPPLADAARPAAVVFGTYGVLFLLARLGRSGDQVTEEHLESLSRPHNEHEEHDYGNPEKIDPPPREVRPDKNDESEYRW